MVGAPIFGYLIGMRFRRFLLAIVVANAACGAHAELRTEAREALDRATAFFASISTRGGYVWWCSEDLRQRSGENKATETQIWVQPPGTPVVGMAFLRAWEVTKNPRCLAAAEAAGEALAWGQLESGGWTYLIDFDPRNQRWYRRAEKGTLPSAQVGKRRNVTTFDDDTTQSALRFLLALAEAAPTNQPVRVALDYGLEGLLRAQYPNGAWPQGYDGKPQVAANHLSKAATIPENWSRTPDVKEYWFHYTLNDDAMRDCVMTLLEAHRRLGKPEYLQAAQRAGEFILLAQLPAPQPGWAQQYNFNMEPAWARRFEPPAVCSAETAGIIRTLVDLHLATGEARYLKPIPAAIDWLRRSAIAPEKWARFYELGSNKPLYFTKDYRLVHTDDNLPTHYGFQGEFGIPGAINHFGKVAARHREAGVAVPDGEPGVGAREPGRVGSLEQEPGRVGAPSPTAPERTQRKEQSRLTSTPPREAKVREIIASLDARGRWITRGRIESRVFVANVNALCDYLAASE